jgi:outer membrane biosynthesis protein TonB
LNEAYPRIKKALSGEVFTVENCKKVSSTLETIHHWAVAMAKSYDIRVAQQEIKLQKERIEKQTAKTKETAGEGTEAAEEQGPEEEKSKEDQLQDEAAAALGLIDPLPPKKAEPPKPESEEKKMEPEQIDSKAENTDKKQDSAKKPPEEAVKEPEKPEFTAEEIKYVEDEAYERLEKELKAIYGKIQTKAQYLVKLHTPVIFKKKDPTRMQNNGLVLLRPPSTFGELPKHKLDWIGRLNNW